MPPHNFYKIKDGESIINLDECESIDTHWIDSFGVEHIPKKRLEISLEIKIF